MSDFSVVPLRSGSSGNLTLIERGGTTLLVDAGLSSRRGLAEALAEAGRTWDDVDAVIVSHLHTDHIHPAAVACCARHEVPILLHKKNVRPFARRILSRSPASGPLQTFDGEPFRIGDIGIRAFTVPHDAEGVCSGFLFSARPGARDVRIAMATDLGHGGNGLFEEFVDSDLILIEANYDPGMLAASRRRDKARIDSDEGHLSNEQAGRFLVRTLLASRRPPRAIVLCHLSEDHNTPARAKAAVGAILAGYGFGEVPVHAARRGASSPRFFAVEAGKG